MTRATTYPIVLLLLTIMTTGPAAADAPIMVQAIASRDASSSIISINLESGAQFELVPSGPARASLVLVSARDELLFFETGHDNTQDIIAHCLKTGRRQVVHRTGKLRAATLAADPTGSRLYYCVGERETGPCGWFMVSVDREGGPDQVPRSVFQRTGQTIQYPSLAQDGRSMLVAYYPSHSWSPNFEIHHAVIEDDGTLGEPRQITRNSLIDLCPAVMPGGRMVWLSQKLNGPTRLMIASDDGTRAQTLHATPGRHVTLSRPAVADEWICFAENQGQDAVIVLMRSDGSVAGRYAVEGCRISDPVIAASRTGRTDSRVVAVLPSPDPDRDRAAFFLPRKFDVPSGRWSFFNPEIRKAKATIRHFEGKAPGVPLGVRLYHDSQLGSIATEVHSAEWLMAFEDAFAIIHEEAGRAGFDWWQVANWDYGNLTIATRQALLAYASDLNNPGIHCVRSELVQDFVDELVFLNGGAVCWKSPSPDLARGPAEQPPGLLDSHHVIYKIQQ